MGIIYQGNNRRNLVINGDFSVAQRGISQTSNGYGSDDMWMNDNLGSSKTHSLEYFSEGQVDVPYYPTRYSRTVVSSVTGAGNYVRKVYKVPNLYLLSGELVTLSFYGKADATKNLVVEFGLDLGPGGTPQQWYTAQEVKTFVLSSAWQRYIHTFKFSDFDSYTLGAENRDYTWVAFWMDAGSDFNSRVNSLGHQSGIFDIADVQLELGSQATPFDRKSVESTLLECLPFYEVVRCSSIGWSAGVNLVPEAAEIKFKVKKHYVPTISHINTLDSQLITLPGVVYDLTVHGCKYAFDTTGSGNFSFIGDISASSGL